MIETFVLTELARQLSGSSERARLHNYRTNDRGEVDDVLKTPDSRVVAIGVKAGATVRAEDLADNLPPGHAGLPRARRE